jgi:hypothetical protein
MLGATTLLYRVTLKLSNQVAAVLAASLWMISVPDLKLTFATYDPLSVFLTTLAVWLATRVPSAKYRGELVAVTAVVLALANATAFSGVVISPIVLGFIFLVWLPQLGKQRALICIAWLIATWLTVFCVLITVSHTWAAIMYTVFARQTLSYDRQDTVAISNDVWAWSGIVIALAMIGTLVAITSEPRKRSILLAVCGVAVFVVPVAQIHDQTSVSLDKHLAYGVWFGAIVAGYGISKIISGFRPKRYAAVLICSAALVYPSATGWVGAWQQFHGWPNSNSLITSIKPLVNRSQGLVSIAGGSYIAEYYMGQALGWQRGIDWTRWNEQGLVLNPTIPAQAWEGYYLKEINTINYSVIALFYVTSLSSPTLPGSLLLSPKNDSSRQLLNLVVANTGHGEPGLGALTTALESDRRYQLSAVGPYGSRFSYGIYAIWTKVGR